MSWTPAIARTDRGLKGAQDDTTWRTYVLPVVYTLVQVTFSSPVFHYFIHVAVADVLRVGKVEVGVDPTLKE